MAVLFVSYFFLRPVSKPQSRPTAAATTGPAKGPLPFTGSSKLNAYAYVSYTIKQKGQSITKEYVLEYSYNDYMIDKIVLDAGTENETFVKPSAGGIDKKN